MDEDHSIPTIASSSHFIFLVHKYLADGSFNKVKARLVYGATNSGTLIDDEPRDTASPTVNPITTLVILFLIASHDMRMEVRGRLDMAEDAQRLHGFVGSDVTEHISRLFTLANVFV